MDSAPWAAGRAIRRATGIGISKGESMSEWGQARPQCTPAGGTAGIAGRLCKKEARQALLRRREQGTQRQQNPLACAMKRTTPRSTGLKANAQPRQ